MDLLPTEIIQLIVNKLRMRDNLNLKQLSKYYYNLNFKLYWSELFVCQGKLLDYIKLNAAMISVNNIHVQNFLTNIISLRLINSVNDYEIKHLTNLEWLVFDDDVTPITIAKLPKLRLLSIDGDLTEYDLTSFSQLTSLDFNNEDRYYWPDNLSFLSKVHWLTLRHVSFNSLPNINSLVKLDHLALVKVKIDNIDSLSLSGLTRLTSLHLEIKFMVDDIPSTMTSLATFNYLYYLPNLPNLQKYKTENHLGDLSGFPNLIKLNIDKNYDFSKLTKLKKLTINNERMF